MVAIAPDTDVILLKVPLQLNQEHQLNFANATAQFNYFNSLPKIVGTNFSYQRKDDVVRFEANFEDLIGFNYMMYRNDAYGDKWFYAFIDDMEFKNTDVTNLSIKTDVWQTWQFDLTWKNTFIEREHTNDDTVGANVVPEGLEVGEYVYNGASATIFNQGGLMICLQVTELLSELSFPQGSNPTIYNNMFNGLPIIGLSTSNDGYNQLRAIKTAYDNAGKSDAIVSIFYCFADLVTVAKDVSLGGSTFKVYYPQTSYSSTLLDSKTIVRPNAINGYTPKNNKLHTFPFTYIYATNHVGTDVEYRWENFSNTASATFDGVGAVGQGCSTKMYPKNYKGFGSAYDFGITGAKLPCISWASDYYLNYMAQNNFNISAQVGSGILGAVASVGSLNPAGAVMSVYNNITNVMGEVHKASIVPDQARGNTNNSDINFSSGYIGWSVYNMSIKAQFARQIDDYFSMYGYATHRNKTPNITGRRNWNYVKTVGCYIQSTAPQQDIQELEEMFNRGITIWHNPATFMDYTQNNAII